MESSVFQVVSSNLTSFCSFELTVALTLYEHHSE